jgi:hypothetical protein
MKTWLKGKNWAKRCQAPASVLECTWCDRAHYDRTHDPQSIASHVSPWSRRCPSRPYAPSLQWLRRGNSEVVICDRSQHCAIERSAVNAAPTIKHTRHSDAFMVKRTSDNWTHAGMRLIAQPATEHTPDLVAWFILSINRTLPLFLYFHAWEMGWGTLSGSKPHCSSM